MHIRVYNKQQYAVGRGGVVFPPRAEIEVETRTKQQLAEIKACVYLKVREVPDIPELKGETEVELPVDEALNSLTKPELQKIATDAGLDLPSKATKAQFVAAIIAASDQESISDEDILNAMTLEELRGEASAYEIDVPDDAGKDDLVTLITATIEALNDPTVVRLDALDEMSDDELRALLDAHGVDFADAATHEQLIGAVVSSDRFQVEIAEDDVDTNTPITPSTVTTNTEA